MKMRYIGFFVIMFLLTCGSAISQTKAEIEAVAVEQIDNLKNGTLLIKLNTQSERINNRLETGQKKRAQKLIDEVEKEHAEIISAFENSYTFSNYYFFLSDDSNSVITKGVYKELFKVKGSNKGTVKNVENPFVLILGVPPGQSSAVDKYKFVLYEIVDKKIKRCHRPIPHVFKTRNGFFQSFGFLSQGYKFDYSVDKLNERLIEFYKKSQTEYYQKYLR